MKEYSKLTDDDLINLINESNSNALKELFDRYYSLLCRFSFKYLLTKDLTEEAVSDIFLNIWIKRREIEIQSSVKAYLYRAVRNQSINYLKKYKSRNYESTSDEKNEVLVIADFAKNIETNDEVEKLLMTLPERRQLVFKMSRLDGLKYKEIAEILSISPNTVQNHIVEAVKTLMKYSPEN